jgi:hypothetical protein
VGCPAGEFVSGASQLGALAVPRQAPGDRGQPGSQPPAADRPGVPGLGAGAGRASERLHHRVLHHVVGGVGVAEQAPRQRVQEGPVPEQFVRGRRQGLVVGVHRGRSVPLANLEPGHASDYATDPRNLRRVVELVAV